ncbi:abortive infection system antitoxin AbiGi family protein [Pyxidicoccus sp. 3LG]
MLQILGSQTLLPGPRAFGIAHKKQIVAKSQRSVCFSEIPLNQLGRLVKRRKSKYGIGFRKSFITSRGGGPIWYVQFGSSAHEALRKLIDKALKGPDPQQDPIWRMTPFIDIKGNHTNAPYKYDFDWEREWRVPGPLPLEFKAQDVAMLFIPEELHSAAWTFFDDAVNDNRGPGYFCPYLDPEWDSEQIKKALAKYSSYSTNQK